MFEEKHIEKILRHLLRALFEVVREELERFADALALWVNELLSHRLPADWREQMHAFFDAQAADGFEVDPPYRRVLENYIAAWGKARGILPEEASNAVASAQNESRWFVPHPANFHTRYTLPEGSELTEQDAVDALQMAKLAEQLRIAIANLESAHDNPTLLARINATLNPLADPYARRSEMREEIWQLRICLRELEEYFRDLGYEGIEWGEFGRTHGHGLEAAASASYAGPPHGIHSVTIDTLMTVGGVAQLTTLTGKVLARASARLASRLVLRQARFREPKSKILIDTFESLGYRRDIPGQRHHLNQTAAYGSKIPFKLGMSIKLEGNILKDATAPHTRAHRWLEVFWDRYRGTIRVPTNLQYTLELKRSLRAAGLSEVDIQLAVRAAVRERVQYGLLGGSEVPAVPNSIRNLAQ